MLATQLVNVAKRAALVMQQTQALMDNAYFKHADTAWGMSCDVPAASVQPHATCLCQRSQSVLIKTHPLQQLNDLAESSD